MIAEAITSLQASREINLNDSSTITVSVKEVVDATASDFQKVLQVKVQGAMKLTGTKNNAGLHDLGASIDLELFNKESVKFAKARAAKITGDIGKTTLKRVSEHIALGIEKGQSITETAKAIRELFDGMSTSRSELIAQVETGIASGNGDYLNAQMTGLDLMKLWSSAQDEKVRDSHRIDGEAVDMDETFSNDLLFPMDPDGPIEEIANCFIGETNVESADASALFRQWYDGEIVTIQTASGVKLSGTPNHPIATISGWKPLGLLNESDDVISGRFEKDGLALVDPDGNQIPTMLHDLYRTALTFSECHRIGNRNVNFYGDRGTGDVDYVGIQWMLRNGRDSAQAQPSNHVEFASSDLAFAKRCGTDEMLPISPDSIMRSSGPGQPLGRSGAFHPQEHAVASRPGLPAIATQDPIDSGSISAEACGQLLGGIPSIERLDDCSFGILTGSEKKIPLFGSLRNQGGTTAESICAGLNSESVLAGLDKIVAIERSQFSGHVYTLETRRGYYIANGVIVKNCRCVALYVPADEVDQWN